MGSLDRSLGREVESGFRYTPTSCFETFPFPSPTAAQREVVARAAEEVDSLRNRWLNPPEWVRENVLEFPASVEGPWAALVTDPNRDGVGTARYVTLVPVNDEAQLLLKRIVSQLGAFPRRRACHRFPQPLQAAR